MKNKTKFLSLFKKRKIVPMMDIVNINIYIKVLHRCQLDEEEVLAFLIPLHVRTVQP